MVAVQVDGLEWPATAADVQAVGLAANVGAHQTRSLHKADIALDGGLTHALDGDAVVARARRCERTQRDEVAGRGGITLHRDLTRRGVTAAGGHHETRSAFGSHVHTELAKQVERDVDVGT